MLSNSRIYIFNIKYKEKTWLEILDTNQLSGLIANMLKSGVPDLSFKNIEFINTFEDNKYCCQIHINKLKYREKRVIPKDEVKDLSKKVTNQLKKIQFFVFEQLHVVNDEFSRQPSTGFLTDEMFYV